MGTKEIFVSGTVSFPFAVTVKQNCIVNGIQETIEIEKVEIPNLGSGKKEREFCKNVVKELKQKHNLI